MYTWRLSDIYLHHTFCRYVVMRADDTTTTGILSTITNLKPSLAEFIQPDFGLLNDLVDMDVVTRRQASSVRSERTVYERNDALLELLTTENQCVKFLDALQLNDQQHVVNFISQNGGQKHNDVVTYLTNVSPTHTAKNRHYALENSFCFHTHKCIRNQRKFGSRILNQTVANIIILDFLDPC